ncbi:SDR family oxidoreductase [Corallococcus carmarthensis]|uniref:SDR family oxidoreductase n=1 Tax=Corallococcus carmarthensis TaxID=2316728 RepID=A0A3A8K6T7_9BACT|nr:SDR family oxidoreductase [Corallococcus carmarthensis]NOK19129.1 SDR family oxidoreductase [Corallococcus carmarthensis]RKH03780.1 SDR family oxidoreductase [Corallococcus carmarthensis]
MAPVALVTGTSTGIGLSTAVHLARQGFEVVATLRDSTRADALRARADQEGVKLHIRTLDVTSDASTQACLRDVLQAHGRIDLLVNNAGAGYLATLEQTSEEALRRTMEVNFFGVWRVTQAVLPVMREQGSGRIISLSSIGGLVGQPFNDAYCAAKFAVEGFMESLAPVAARLGIHVSLVEPGPVHTEFVNNVRATGNGTQGNGPAVYGELLGRYMQGSAATYASLGQTPDDIARIICEAAASPAPHLRYITSDAMRALFSLKAGDATGDTLRARIATRLD